MNTISQHILSVVETKREQLGMSKAELARRMDINPVTLGTMLRGTRAMYADEAIKTLRLPRHRTGGIHDARITQKAFRILGQARHRATSAGRFNALRIGACTTAYRI